MTRATIWLLAIATTAGALAGCTSGAANTTGAASTASAGHPSSLAPPAPAPVTSAHAGRYAAPLPAPLLLVQGVSSANPAHTFRTQAWDFAMMRETFNAVALEPGDPRTVARARAAGLAVILEFDYKKDFFAGKDISAKVARIVGQVRSNPGTVSGIQVADRLNQDYSPSQGLRYLAATAGVFHRELPGVPVVVSVADRDLTCGLPGQSSCHNTDPRYQYQTTATLDAFRASGYLDGFTLADNLKNDDAAIQARAWQTARARWPSPFILLSNASQLSFPTPLAPGGQQAAGLVAAYMTAPVRDGADGIALWAWHQLYQGSVYTFLDKDGHPNTLWHEMAAAAATLALTGDRHG
jgi:hypothetical protein